MKQMTSTAKAATQTRSISQTDSSAGQNAISIAPPDYGIDFVDSDQAVAAPLQRSSGLPIQAKIQIGQPGDIYEQEANQIAKQVMSMPEPAAQRQAVKKEEEEKPTQTKPLAGQITPLVQRQPEEEEEEVLQGTFTTSETSAQLQGDVGESQNRTGMPRPLKAGLEALSGMDLSGVKVHTNSSKPAQLNALAYTQGQDIHVGPGQEKHLPHEGWHAVQQMQGRVQPTTQIGSVSINDDGSLEHEADVMGAKALQPKREEEVSGGSNTTAVQSNTAQCMADKSDVPTGMACTVDTAPGRPAGTNILFDESEHTLDTADTPLIATDYATWFAGGGLDTIIVDGFASSDGSPGNNWRLSCNRAEAVKAEFVRLGVPAVMVTTIAHGETEEFSATSHPPNRIAVIHTVSGTVPFVFISPVIFGSMLRVPPGVGTSVVVVVTGLPAGRTIALDIQGSGGTNGTATIAPASIAGTSAVTVTGGAQTTPGNANNLMVRARIGGRTLATSFGFTVAAHPRDFSVTLNADFNTATSVGLRANNAWTGDGSGGVADLTEAERSEQVDILTRDNPPFTSAAGTSATTGTSSFIPGTASPTVDTHTYSVASIWRPFFLRLLGNSFTIVYEQLFIFNDRRTGVTNQVVPNSGFTITHTLTWNAGRGGWDHQCVKTGAATSVGAFSATAGAGTATSLVHPL